MDNKKKIAIVGAAFLMYSLSKKKDKIAIDNIVDSLEKHPTKTFTKRNTGQIDRIILHHYAGMGTPQAVAHYHVKPEIWVNKTPLEIDPNTGGYKQKNIGGRNWPGIAYHYVINQDGSINQTNYHDTISYHVSGENYRSIGVAMEGDFTSIPPTTAQIISLNLLIPHIRTQFSQPLEVYQHSDFANKPYDANMDLTPYKLASISAIYKEGNQNLTMCQDGTYTDSYAGGTCSHHGGFYNELDSISEDDLEAYFYKEYLIGDYMRANKINISDFKRYGDRNLIREKLHWIQKDATPLDTAAQSLSWQIGVTVTPQDLIDIVMDYPSPKAYIDDMKYQLLEMQKRQQGMFGINAIQKDNKCPEFTECSDGTYSTKKGRGTCSRHGGVLIYGKEKKKPTAKAAQKQPFKKETITKPSRKKIIDEYREQFRQAKKDRNYSIKNYRDGLIDPGATHDNFLIVGSDKAMLIGIDKAKENYVKDYNFLLNQLNLDLSKLGYKILDEKPLIYIAPDPVTGKPKAQPKQPFKKEPVQQKYIPTNKFNVGDMVEVKLKNKWIDTGYIESYQSPAYPLVRTKLHGERVIPDTDLRLRQKYEDRAKPFEKKLNTILIGQEGISKVINDLFKEFQALQTESEDKNFKKKIGRIRFGTYLNKSVLHLLSELEKNQKYIDKTIGYTEFLKESELAIQKNTREQIYPWYNPLEMEEPTVKDYIKQVKKSNYKDFKGDYLNKLSKEEQTEAKKILTKYLESKQPKKEKIDIDDIEKIRKYVNDFMNYVRQIGKTRFKSSWTYQKESKLIKENLNTKINKILIPIYGSGVDYSKILPKDLMYIISYGFWALEHKKTLLDINAAFVSSDITTILKKGSKIFYDRNKPEPEQPLKKKQ